MISLGGRSLRSRLFAATTSVLIISIGITLAVGTVLTRRSLEHRAQKELSREADLLAQRESQALLPFKDIRDGEVQRLLSPRHEIADEVAVLRPSPLLDAAERAKLLEGRAIDGTKTIAGHRSFYSARIVVCPLRGERACRQRSGAQKTGKVPKALIVYRRASLSSASWRPFLEGLLLAALVGAVLGAGAAVLLARAIVRPVGRVAAASRSLASGESPDPLPLEGPDELSTLAASFNHMARQLERARAAERSFLLSVSHELKTPLTAIRGYAEALAEGAFSGEEAGETIAREARRLERLVRDLLDLARMNKSEFSVDVRPLDLAQIADEVVARYEPQARSFEISLEPVGDGGAAALGDPDRVLQVVSNLVENALRLTPPGGSVRVEAGRGTIVVSDTGPGLGPDELSRAFERFFLYSRYGGERPVGTGLGLAIVKELTTAMAGTVDVTSEPGRGARFTVRLPVPEATSTARDGGRTRDRAPVGPR